MILRTKFTHTVVSYQYPYFILSSYHIYYTRNDTKVAQPEFVDITGLMVNEH